MQEFTSPNDAINKNSIDQLFNQALKYKGSEQYKRFFGFIARFNHYSRYNSMLVYLQNPAVTFFGSSWYWKSKFQRKIKVDPKPLLILAPNGPIILAYDVFDTIGKKSPEQFLEEGLNGKLFEVRGMFKNEYLTALKNFASDYGISITVKPLNYFNAGSVTTYVSGKSEIYLREGHSSAQHFATLCHELAHILLCHNGNTQLRNKKNKPVIILAGRPLPLKLRELEAETVTFLVCTRIGLDAGSIEYLSGYLPNEKDWELFSYNTVIKVSDKLSSLIDIELKSKTSKVR